MKILLLLAFLYGVGILKTRNLHRCDFKPELLNGGVEGYPLINYSDSKKGKGGIEAFSNQKSMIY